MPVWLYSLIRRRGLEPAKMALIRDYINRGGPVLGIRTASHSFAPQVPKGQSKDFLSGFATWPEIDAEFLGQS